MSWPASPSPLPSKTDARWELLSSPVKAGITSFGDSWCRQAYQRPPRPTAPALWQKDTFQGTWPMRPPLCCQGLRKHTSQRAWAHRRGADSGGGDTPSSAGVLQNRKEAVAHLTLQDKTISSCSVAQTLGPVVSSADPQHFFF